MNAVTTQSQQFGKVAVLMGGRSAERDISIKSGTAILNALKRLKIDAASVDIADCAFSAFMNQNFDRVFIAMHGRGGEDGTVQGFLKTIELPFTG